MPESATIEEVEKIYFEGWKLGLKALAIYRDNCKVGQPLSDGKGKNDGTKAETVVEAAPASLSHPVRKRLPKKRTSVTTSFSVAGAEGYMTAGMYEDGSLGEVFLKLGKQGSTLAGVMDAFSISLSIALQHGVPLETYIQKFTNMRFEPAGMTDDPDIRIAQSVMDYIFRRLALDHLPVETRATLGIFTAEERAAQVAGSYGTSASTATVTEEEEVDLEQLRSSAPIETAKVEEKVTPEGPKSVKEAHSSAELLELVTGTATDAPLCMTCGTKMRPAGSCYVCEGCGSTSGCS
jgi:ribonucleoside-diphosphate reductase alpha chain